MSARAAARRRLRRPQVVTAALGGLMLGVAVVVLVVGRDTTFFFDEWNFILDRRGHGADVFLDGHNGHLSLLPVLVYKGLLETVGLDHYWLYRSLLVVLHLASGGLVFALARRRTAPWPAFMAAALVLVLGAAWDDLLWAFQIGFLGSVAAGLAMLLALDRKSPRADVLAAVALGVSLACSGLGSAFALAAIVELALGRQWRRLAVVCGPALALYGLWTLGYGDSNVHLSNLGDAPAFMANMASAAAGGLAGVGSEFGSALAVGAAVALVWWLSRRPLSPRGWGLVAALAGYWGLTALTRAHLGEPEAPRYIYLGGVLIVLLAVELTGPRLPARGRALVVAGALVGFAALGNLGTLEGGGRALRDTAAGLRAELAAFELVEASVPSELRFTPERAPQIRAGAYRAAVEDYGSPALPPVELPRAGAAERQAADDVLRRVLPVTPAAGEFALAGTPPTQVAADGAAATPVGACLRIVPERPGATVDVRLPVSGLGVSASSAPAVELRLRRFGDAFPDEPPGQLAPGGPITLRLPPDRSDAPWIVRLTASSPLRACGLG
jgi:hypothetical protein